MADKLPYKISFSITIPGRDGAFLVSSSDLPDNDPYIICLENPPDATYTNNFDLPIRDSNSNRKFLVLYLINNPKFKGKKSIPTREQLETATIQVSWSAIDPKSYDCSSAPEPGPDTEIPNPTSPSLDDLPDIGMPPDPVPSEEQLANPEGLCHYATILIKDITKEDSYTYRIYSNSNPLPSASSLNKNSIISAMKDDNIENLPWKDSEISFSLQKMFIDDIEEYWIPVKNIDGENDDSKCSNDPLPEKKPPINENKDKNIRITIDHACEGRKTLITTLPKVGIGFNDELKTILIKGLVVDGALKEFAAVDKNLVVNFLPQVLSKTKSYIFNHLDVKPETDGNKYYLVFPTNQPNLSQSLEVNYKLIAHIKGSIEYTIDWPNSRIEFWNKTKKVRTISLKGPNKLNFYTINIDEKFKLTAVQKTGARLKKVDGFDNKYVVELDQNDGNTYPGALLRSIGESIASNFSIEKDVFQDNTDAVFISGKLKKMVNFEADAIMSPLWRKWQAEKSKDKSICKVCVYLCTEDGQGIVATLKLNSITVLLDEDK